MIFSLLKIRKKTAAVISGIAIAMACLWGLAMWQDISPAELLRLAGASLLMILVIAILAVLLITIFKLIGFLLRKLLRSDSDQQS